MGTLPNVPDSQIRSPPIQGLNRTRSTRRYGVPAAWTYKRKDQCAQVSLAFDNVVGATVAIDRMEREGEVQPAEFGLHAHDIVLQDSGEVRQLMLPFRGDIELALDADFTGRPHLRFELGDDLLALRDGVQDSGRARGAVLQSGEQILELAPFLFEMLRRCSPVNAKGPTASEARARRRPDEAVLSLRSHGDAGAAHVRRVAPNNALVRIVREG